MMNKSTDVDVEYEIEDINNLKQKCEIALKAVSNYGDFTINNFSIKKDELNVIITNWQKSYKELHKELEEWKRRSKFSHETETYETVALLCKKKEVECVFLKVYDSGESDILNCISISRTFTKPGIISKLLNKIFKHKSQKTFKRLAKSQPETIAALILSRDGGLKILWK
ncbi:hypothetical protein C1646_665379 [Rhizophagus diaphanus]|nr:hypothetical protein C1646_665379 [Rhizophagus diaphanus] [Rhizophagus sp. MUCL 43196]